MDVMLQETPLIGSMRSEAKSSSAVWHMQMKATARVKHPMEPPVGCSVGCQLLWEKVSREEPLLTSPAAEL